MIGYFVLLLIMTLIGSVAAMFLKKASGANDIISLLTNINLYVGAFLYFFSAVLNIIVLRHLDYSMVLPLTSITYIWTLMLSKLFLQEVIKKRKLFGILCIATGAFLITM